MKEHGNERIWLSRDYRHPRLTNVYTMEVHRCRFSEWMPSAVCATVFHPELPMVIVGRENGDIELWNTEERWFCEFVGTKGCDER